MKQVTMDEKQYDDYLEYLTTAPNVQRFETHFNKTEGCWNWTSAKNQHGYGEFMVRQPSGNYKMFRANRYSFRVYKGPIIGIVRHTCDNPGCVNPEHLIDGTHKDNSVDMISRNRGSKGIDRPAHKLTEQDVLEIKNTPNVYGSGVKLATKFNVTPSLISYVRNGGWKHV